MNKENVVKEIRSWIGTRWVHGMAAKGRGTDCIQFIVAVSIAVGWLPEGFKTIPYRVDYARHNYDSILMREIMKYCDRVPLDEIQEGDILLFVSGKCVSHAGFYVGGGRMVHAHIRNGVTEILVKGQNPHSAWRVKHG